MRLQTPAKFGEVHYPGAPVLSTLYGGRIEVVWHSPITKNFKPPVYAPGVFSKRIKGEDPKFAQYKMKSIYKLKKPLYVKAKRMPVDVYQYRFEVDLEPITIYRLTPQFERPDDMDEKEKKRLRREEDDTNAKSFPNAANTPAYQICPEAGHEKGKVKDAYKKGDKGKDAYIASEVVSEKYNVHQSPSASSAVLPANPYDST